jgi:SAM-dependent methyltransferase
MNRETREALNALNRRFYRRHAAAFDGSRHAPWQGWRRVVELLPVTGALTVLDVGCGNGRFGVLLGDRLGAERLHYRGVDSSLPLLVRARRRLGRGGAWMGLELVVQDVVQVPPSVWARPPRRCGGGWGLITAFGLMHHLPGRLQRLGFLEALARQLAPGGLLAVALWRFGEDPRFERRRIPWEVYNASVAPAARVDPAELEAGDRLLRWGSNAEGDGDDPAVPVAEGAWRYCHAVDREEEGELVAGLEPLASPVHTFDADGRSGRLNRYLLFQRSAGAVGGGGDR